VRRLLASWCLLGAFCLVLSYSCGCSGAAATAYTSDHLTCVDKATTKAESRACREEVRRDWGKSDAGK
jgi:hypothetical protein